MASYELPSLLQLSIQKLTRGKGGPSGGCCELTSSYTQDLACLPNHLKDGLRGILLKRRNLSPQELQVLVHPNVREVDLSEQVISPRLLGVLSVCTNIRKVNLNQSDKVEVLRPNTQATQALTGAGQTEEGHQLAAELTRFFFRQPHLNTVHMRGLRSLNTEVVFTLATRCPNLSHLDLGGCDWVEDEAVFQLRRCENLHSLSLAKTGISDLGLHSLASSSSRNSLAELRIDSCQQITDNGIQVLLDGLNSLQILIFHSCPQITERARVSLEGYLARHARAVKQLTWTVY